MSYSQFHIYHTNDLHSHFEQWPKIISLLQEKQSYCNDINKDVLLFDIGDHADRVHPLTEATMGKGNVALMNDAGYHATTIGNNEGITLSKEALSSMYEEANFSVLVANLFDASTKKRPSWLKPYEIITLSSGVNVAVIGMTIPFKPFYEALGWMIEDPFELLPSLIKEVRRQADIVIFLSHLGLNFDEQVARSIEGVDIILGGHTHNVLDKGMVINNTVIHQAGKFGQYVGELCVTFDHNQGRLVDFQAACLEVADYNSCEKTEDRIAALTERSTHVLSEQIATIPEVLDVSWLEQSRFPTLLAESLKEWCDGEIGMVNSGVILDQLAKGPVTRGDLHRVCPHPINPCKVELSGQILKETIQYVLSREIVHKKIRGFGFRGKVMGKMAFAGVTYDSNDLTDGLTHISNIQINGSPIESERTYEVATIDMFTFGHLLPAISSAKIKTYYMPELLRDLLAWKLR